MASLPDGNDVGEEQHEAEEVAVPGATEPLEAHHHHRQAQHSHKQQLREK